MDINQLIKNTNTVYREALQTREEERLDRALNLALKQSANSVMEIKEKHAKLSLPENITEKVIEAATSEYKAMQELQNSLTKTNKKEVLQNTTEAYLEGVRQFTESGGKNFYDIGCIMSFRDKYTGKQFQEQIKQLQEKGMDIKIIKEKHFEHKNVDRYTVSDIYSLVLPSSQYSAFEKFVVNNLPEDDGLNMSRENFFIPPFIKGRESIPSLEEYVSKVEKDIDYYNFTPYGYSTVKIDTSGGYGKFVENRPDVINLKRAINLSLECVALYDYKSDPVNGMMPTLACYGKDDLKKLNIENEENSRKTIVKDIKLDDIEQELKLEKKKKRSHSRP